MEKFAIVLKEVNKSYGTKKILKNVSFKVSEGTIHGFIGPNGAGKSTTINIMRRLVFPNNLSDCVWISGKSINNPNFNENLFSIPAEPVFFKEENVRDHLLSVAYLRDIPEREVLNKLDSSALSEHWNHKCKDLSTGQKKMLLALGAVGEVKVMLLDEPFNGLDPTVRHYYIKYLEEFKAKGGTVFISTHILSDLQTLADDITMIRSGEIVYSGKITDDIEQTYVQYFVKPDEKKVFF